MSSEFNMGPYTNYVDKQGGGGCQMPMLLHKLRYVINLSLEGEGGQKSSKSCLCSLCMAPKLSLSAIIH